MNRAMIKQDRVCRAVGLAAVLALLVQVLLIPLKATPQPVEARYTAHPAQHHVQGHEHGAPADPARSPEHRSHGVECCILGGLLGVALGPIPVASVAPLPLGGSFEIPVAEPLILSGWARSFLPVGARAPPRLA
jgi:hypothetical protein